VPHPNPRGRPPVTSRAQILAAARSFIDREGWDNLTIRRLAAELNIGTMTLYHHVRDKEDLLLLLIHEYANQIPHPELPDAPRDRIIIVATTIHDALADWPWAAKVLTTDGFIARLGDSAWWLVETIVAAAINYGCTPEQAVHIFHSIWCYTVGEILLNPRRPDTSPSQDNYFGNLDPSRLPHLAALGDQWQTLAEQDTYTQGLHAFVDGLLAQATKP
jgi:AcrR family transcriptional regulator